MHVMEEVAWRGDRVLLVALTGDSWGAWPGRQRAPKQRSERGEGHVSAHAKALRPERPGGCAIARRRLAGLGHG